MEKRTKVLVTMYINDANTTEEIDSLKRQMSTYFENKTKGTTMELMDVLIVRDSSIKETKIQYDQFIL